MFQMRKEEVKERMYNLVKKVKEGIWTGRTDHVENRASFRYHQIVELEQIETLDSEGKHV